MTKIILLSIMCMSASISFADPFMGEGKQNYIRRCESSAEVPGFSRPQITKMCECIADGQEIRWYELLDSIRQSEHPDEIQEKVYIIMKEISEECYVRIK